MYGSSNNFVISPRIVGAPRGYSVLGVFVDIFAEELGVQACDLHRRCKVFGVEFSAFGAEHRDLHREIF